jgi:hypothetical protein
VFEKDYGIADKIEKQYLEDGIKKAGIQNKPQMVMIQSCHSEESGKVFFQAGIDHVICVRQEKEIDEVACHIFANSFYTYLFKS